MVTETVGKTRYLYGSRNRSLYTFLYYCLKRFLKLSVVCFYVLHFPPSLINGEKLIKIIGIEQFREVRHFWKVRFGLDLDVNWWTHLKLPLIRGVRVGLTDPKRSRHTGVSGRNRSEFNLQKSFTSKTLRKLDST